MCSRAAVGRDNSIGGDGGFPDSRSSDPTTCRCAANRRAVDSKNVRSAACLAVCDGCVVDPVCVAGPGFEPDSAGLPQSQTESQCSSAVAKYERNPPIASSAFLSNHKCTKMSARYARAKFL